MMKTAKHTPGPWDIGKDAIGDLTIYKYASQTHIAKVIINPHGNEDVGRANAQLIASAPELLEACRLAVVDYEYQNEGYAPRPDTPVIKALKQAISKAEGK